MLPAASAGAAGKAMRVLLSLIAALALAARGASEKNRPVTKARPAGARFLKEL